VRSKENISTKILRKWKEDTRVGGMCNLMGDYCWTLHWEIPETSPKGRSNIRSFAGKKKRQYTAIE
jgi:hypothetical protein